jgi:hypothetical protein
MLLTLKWPKNVATICIHPEHSGFVGLVVSMLVSDTQDRGFAPGRSRLIFRAKKPQHAFLQNGSKAVCPMS